MKNFAKACESIAGTTKKLEKVAIVAEFLKSCQIDDAAIATVFLSGSPFAAWEQTTLQVGGTLLWGVVKALSGKDESETAAAYRRYGDLGSAAVDLLPDPAVSADMSLGDINHRFRTIAAAKGPAAKRVLVREMLAQASPLEAKYLIKIITGDLRIGLKESLVEEGIAKAYGCTAREVQRANMLLGDIGETLRYAVDGTLSKAQMRLFHPLGFMLASPAETAGEALSYFANPLIEHKYDGIRAQAHFSGNQVRIFSRTRDDITSSFPELVGAFDGLSQDAIGDGAILDGEILAWSYPSEGSNDPGRALPFRVLQARIGRKKVSRELMQSVPIAYLAFDVLYARGELVIDRPLVERAKVLDELLGAPRTGNRIAIQSQADLGFELGSHPNAQIIRAPFFQAASHPELDVLFDEAQAIGNEGLMIKDPTSSYSPGKRGKSWLKLKRELATLDVVVTAVEYGHGRRASVLSDYTFAVRDFGPDGDRLVNIGKAYSGLTDVEIAEMTRWFLEHTLEDEGHRRIVEPTVVIEVAFNNMMISDRHESGYALRFPRIIRLRPDKLPTDADTLQRAKEIYEGQKN
jgi:DNA ligase 1